MKQSDLDPKELPVSTLAYIGDAVMELFFRVEFLSSRRVSAIHEKVKENTSKHGQARLLDTVWEILSDEERGIVKRGMNSKTAKKHGNDLLYRKSTGLETLIGYLYLKGDLRRIEELLTPR